MIYYRINHPLKKDAKLPMLDLLKFYKQSSVHGFDLTLQPDLQYVKNEKIIELTKTSYDEMNDLINKFPHEFDAELIKEMDRYVKTSLNDKEI